MRIYKKQFCLLILLFFMSMSSLWSAESIVGYLPSYRDYNEKQVAPLTDLVIFSAEPTDDGKLKMDPKFSKLLSHISKNRMKDKRYFLCIGGWERSKGFV